MAIYGIYKVDNKKFYLIPIVFACVLIFGMIWYDFRTFNNIKVDLQDKKIEILSRNFIKQIFLKYFLKKKVQYDFDEIDCFIVQSHESTKADFQNHVVLAKLKVSPNITLLSFVKKEHAQQFAVFLTELLKSY